MAKHSNPDVKPIIIANQDDKIKYIERDTQMPNIATPMQTHAINPQQGNTQPAT